MYFLIHCNQICAPTVHTRTDLDIKSREAFPQKCSEFEIVDNKNKKKEMSAIIKWQKFQNCMCFNRSMHRRNNKKKNE